MRRRRALLAGSFAGLIAVGAELLLRRISGVAIFSEIATDAVSYILRPRGFSYLLDRLGAASLADKTMAQKLIMEHEMGELFKVIGFAKGGLDDAMGFAQGDRTHTL